MDVPGIHFQCWVDDEEWCVGWFIYMMYKYKYSVKFKTKYIEHTFLIHEFTSFAGILLFELSLKAV